jgi:hypothetical protein
VHENSVHRYCPQTDQPHGTNQNLRGKVQDGHRVGEEAFKGHVKWQLRQKHLQSADESLRKSSLCALFPIVPYCTAIQQSHSLSTWLKHTKPSAPCCVAEGFVGFCLFFMQNRGVNAIIAGSTTLLHPTLRVLPT